MLVENDYKWLYRSELLLGRKALEVLSKSKVAVFGLGGVGGYVVEALARTGVGQLDLIDNDTFSETNLNRQILALRSNLGKTKTSEAKKRVLEINPKCIVNTYDVFYLPEHESMFDFKKYDYIVDAIDTVTAKLSIIEKAKREGIKVISALGAGNKLNPLALAVSDIYKTSICPLARVIRYECRKRNISDLKVVYSKETPIKVDASLGFPGSVSFVPSVMGLIIGSEVIKDLIN